MERHPRPTHIAPWFACASGLVEQPQLSLKTIIFEGGRRGFFNLEVFIANVEDGAVVNTGDPEFVAQLILPIDTMGPLPHKKILHNLLGSMVVWTFLTDVLAGVEESCLDRSLGADAAGEPRHGCRL